METLCELNLLITKASKIAGSLRKLATMLEMNPAHLSDMKNGRRPANWKVRGKLRVILGEDPARAFMAAMLEDLEGSQNEEEKKAALGLRAALDAFPASGDWRRRSHTHLLRTVMRLRLFIDKALDHRLRNAEPLPHPL